MENLEDEIKQLKERNNELIQKVQFWKMRAAERENEKIELMKELNEFRLKLSRMRSCNAAQARKLDSALQTAGQEALAHLVQASNAVAKTIQMTKTYMQDQRELETAPPKLSGVNGISNNDKILRVPPMLMGGKFIQPVVSLNPVMSVNRPTNSSIQTTRNVSQNRNQNVPLPMHMLQDVYIPLTRIDMVDLQSNAMDTIEDNEDNTEELDDENSMEETMEDSENMGDHELSNRRTLDVVTEESEVEEETIDRTTREENPLEGPSWLLDSQSLESSRRTTNRVVSEPDSTTELEESVSQAVAATEPRPENTETQESSAGAEAWRSAFTPTVRRRRRLTPLATPPPASPAVSPSLAKRISNRQLMVLVSKMHLDGTTPAAQGQPAAAGDTPPKRPPRFDAPSPSGATDAALRLSEEFINQSINPGPSTGSTVMDSKNLQSDYGESRISHERREDLLHDQNRHVSQERSSENSEGQGSKGRRRESHEGRKRSQESRSQNYEGQKKSKERRLDEDRHDNQDKQSSSHESHSSRARRQDGSQPERRHGYNQRQTVKSESRQESDESREESNERELSQEYRLSHEGDIDEHLISRSRRERKPVTYKEKPLNRKMRR